MDIENEKISGRQLGRMVFYDFFQTNAAVIAADDDRRFFIKWAWCIHIAIL